METSQPIEVNDSAAIPHAQPAQSSPPIALDQQHPEPGQESSLDRQLAGLDLENTTPSPTHDSPSDGESNQVASELEGKVLRDLPKSKLLHSNPEPEPKNPNSLTRRDSNAEEVDEFVDAQS